MEEIEILKLYLRKILITFFAIRLICSQTVYSQHLWLSEYGYSDYSSDETTQFSFPVNKNEIEFSNSFLSKSKTEVVIHEHLDFVVLSCDSKDPVYWSIYQDVQFMSENLGTRVYEFQISPNVSKASDIYFRSLIYIHFEVLEKTSVNIFYRDEGWKIICHNDEYYEKRFLSPSIILRLEAKSTEIALKNQAKNEDNIFIAMLSAENNGTLTSKGCDIEHADSYPNFYGNDSQPILLEKNGTKNYDDGSSSNFTKLLETEIIKEGDRIRIICFTSSKIYSFGAYLNILWENGTEMMISEDSSDVKPQIKLSKNSKYLESKLFSLDFDECRSEFGIFYFLSKEIQVQLGMKQVNCHMPDWADKQWIKVSRKLNVIQK